MDYLKKCSKCAENKSLKNDFYYVKGKVRSECKKCTIRASVEFQRKRKTWLIRQKGDEKRPSYMLAYYAKNKDKFPEYRKRFEEKYPGYYKNYAKKRREALKEAAK